MSHHHLSPLLDKESLRAETHHNAQSEEVLRVGSHTDDAFARQFVSASKLAEVAHMALTSHTPLADLRGESVH